MKLLLILLTLLSSFKTVDAETILRFQLANNNEPSLGVLEHHDGTIITCENYRLMIASSQLKNNIYTEEKVPIVKIRTLLLQAAESKKANKELKAILETCNPKDPLINGYMGASVMIEAKHMFNPMARWNKFKAGKALVENAIKADAGNYELRYLRFSIQTNIPPVLGYSADIEADKKLLIDRLRNVNDADLKNRVLNFLLAAKVCTHEELNKLKQWKNG